MSGRTYINASSIWSYEAEEYAQHLRGIMAHDRKMKAVAKSRSAAKARAYAKAKPPARAWSFWVNKKGTGVIAIRGRDPKYITKSEYEEMCMENAAHEALIHLTLKKKKIEVRDD